LPSSAATDLSSATAPSANDEREVQGLQADGWLTTRPVPCEAFYDFAELRSPTYIKIAQERRSRGASY
jgi:hypothetical protein